MGHCVGNAVTITSVNWTLYPSRLKCLLFRFHYVVSLLILSILKYVHSSFNVKKFFFLLIL